MSEYITAGSEGAFVLVFIIITIVSSIIKANKEKKEREERARRMGDHNGGSSPQQTRTSGPSSIEDFLRELAGDKSAAPKRQPEPRPAARQQQEWHAPQSEVQDFLRQAEEKKRRKEQERNDSEKRNRELKRQRRLAEEQKKLERRKRRAAEQKISDAAFRDAYAENIEPVQMNELDLAEMNVHDLRKAVILKEILGPPVALKEISDTEYPAL